MNKNLPFFFIILSAFLFDTLGPLPAAQADDFRLPAPGVMVPLSPVFNPPVLKGIKVHPDDPFRFDFILDKGDSRLSNDQIKDESSKLIKYFLASLTIPEKDLWVNLSPYEKDRIVPDNFGLTEMGRDLLAEDYMLKQITASLIYPEDAVGKKFWERIYEKAEKEFGTTDIPVNTFNKVWIVPEKAVVYENARAGTAYVVESKLKVMLDQDYLALQKNINIAAKTEMRDASSLGSQIVREIVIPELTKEVNEDRNFAQLRQVYNSLILATWYKKKIKDSILAQVYTDRNKISGVTTDDPQEKQKIYERYLQAFKKGVFNYIKEEITLSPTGKEQGVFPRKYFSGGILAIRIDEAMTISDRNIDVGDDPNMVEVDASMVTIPSQEEELDALRKQAEDMVMKVANSGGWFAGWLKANHDFRNPMQIIDGFMGSIISNIEKQGPGNFDQHKLEELKQITKELYEAMNNVDMDYDKEELLNVFDQIVSFLYEYDVLKQKENSDQFTLPDKIALYRNFIQKGDIYLFCDRLNEHYKNFYTNILAKLRQLKEIVTASEFDVSLSRYVDVLQDGLSRALTLSEKFVNFGPSPVINMQELDLNGFLKINLRMEELTDEIKASVLEYLPPGLGRVVRPEDTFFISLPKGEYGDVAKSEIDRVGPHGDAILRGLIDADVVRDFSATEVYLNSGLNEKTEIVRRVVQEEGEGGSFDRVWNILQWSQQQGRGGIAIILQASPHVGKILLDNIQFGRVINNFIENAQMQILKYRQPLPSEVYTESSFNQIAYLLKNRRYIYIKTSADETEVEITISDTGGGMPESVKKSLLGGERTTTKKEGNGWGVINSLEIINLHKGKVSMDNWQDNGETMGLKIHITLPRGLETAEASKLDAAMVQEKRVDNGGIDLSSDKALFVQNNGQSIKFHIASAQLERLQNVPGFTPVIINIQPAVDIRAFLGLK